MSAEKFHGPAHVFAALGDQTRLRLVSRLAAGGLCIARLSDGAAMTRQAVTKHLRALAAGGIATSTRVGREQLWQLTPGALDAARAWLSSHHYRQPQEFKEGQRPMPTVRFTQNIQRHIDCPTRAVDGSTIGEALDRYFRQHEQARSYVLDDQGKLRQHMALFMNGAQIRDREHLSDPVLPDAVIDIVQALSGGSGLR